MQAAMVSQCDRSWRAVSWSQLAELQLQLVDLVGQLGAGQLYCTVLYCTVLYCRWASWGRGSCTWRCGSCRVWSTSPTSPAAGTWCREASRSGPASSSSCRQTGNYNLHIETSLCSIEIVDQMCVKDATYGDIDNRGLVINNLHAANRDMAGTGDDSNLQLSSLFVFIIS